MAKVVEILQENRPFFTFLIRNGISVNDVMWLDLYNEFEKMKADDYSSAEIVTELAKKHNVNKTTIYRALAKLKKEI